MVPCKTLLQQQHVPLLVLLQGQPLMMLILIALTAPASSALRPWLPASHDSSLFRPSFTQVSQDQRTASHVSRYSSVQGAVQGGPWRQPSEPQHAAVPGGSENPSAGHRAHRVGAHVWQPAVQPGRQLLQGGPQPAQPPASPDTGPLQGQDASCLVTVTFGVADGRTVDSSASNSTPSLLGYMTIEPAARPVQVTSCPCVHVWAWKTAISCFKLNASSPGALQVQLLDWALTWRFTAGESVHNTSAFRARGKCG
jgi:hypothetical protein